MDHDDRRHGKSGAIKTCNRISVLRDNYSNFNYPKFTLLICRFIFMLFPGRMRSIFSGFPILSLTSTRRVNSKFPFRSIPFCFYFLQWLGATATVHTTTTAQILPLWNDELNKIRNDKGQYYRFDIFSIRKSFRFSVEYSSSIFQVHHGFSLLPFLSFCFCCCFLPSQSTVHVTICALWKMYFNYLNSFRERCKSGV